MLARLLDAAEQRGRKARDLPELVEMRKLLGEAEANWKACAARLRSLEWVTKYMREIAKLVADHE